jgi:hypothetical protein
MAEAEALAQAQARAKNMKHDSGFPVAIPDIPAVDGGDEEDEPPSIPSVEERSMWSPGQVEESPKLAEARVAMMQTLIANEAKSAPIDLKREPWDESEIPAKPSSLEWPEPPPIAANGSSAARPSEEPIALEEDDLQKPSSPKVPVPAPPPPVPRKGGGAPPLKR